MCTLDSAVISLLLFSVLTTELADELQQNIEGIVTTLSSCKVYLYVVDTEIYVKLNNINYELLICCIYASLLL